MINFQDRSRKQQAVDTWYDLRVQVTGNQYGFYIDDNLVIEYTDDTFPTGKVGIGVGNNDQPISMTSSLQEMVSQMIPSTLQR